MHETHASFCTGFSQANAFHSARTNELIQMPTAQAEQPLHVRDADEFGS